MGKRFPAFLAMGALACAAGLAAPAATQAAARHGAAGQAAATQDAARHAAATRAAARHAAATRAAATRAAATPVKHVVVIYLENQSFDSMLGFWCDDQPGRCPDGGMPSSVPLSNGAVVTPAVNPDTVPNVEHSVPSEVAAIDGGKMDGWQNMPAGTCAPATGYQCISGYTPAQVPNLAALAQQFAISDHTFSVGDSPSWAGHMAIVAASQDHFTGNLPVAVPGVTPGPGWGCDSNKVATWMGAGGIRKSVPSCVPKRLPGVKNGGAFEATPVSTIPTIMDRLEGARLNWKIYGASASQVGYIWSICPTFAGCLDTSQHTRLVPDAQFMTDAAAGKLPSFSIVTPGDTDYLNACHNQMSITACDNWLGQLVTAAESSPDWSSTAVFITFDDCGCFYDQVPPPTEPDGTQEGPRVPMVIVSPYARPGYTDTTATTFAGILAYTEHNFGLSPLGVNDAQAYDFSNAFNYAQVPVHRVTMVNRPLPASARRIRLTRALAADAT
jgi:phospholipase C